MFCTRASQTFVTEAVTRGCFVKTSDRTLPVADFVFMRMTCGCRLVVWLDVQTQLTLNIWKSQGTWKKFEISRVIKSSAENLETYLIDISNTLFYWKRQKNQNQNLFFPASSLSKNSPILKLETGSLLHMSNRKAKSQ